MINIIFICHDEKLVKELYEKYDKPIVLFVGKNEIDATRFSNLTIVRNLPYNIEEEKSLLTFTAWYAIIKNDLFKDYEYLCLLEYDVILKPDFQKRLDESVNTFPNTDLFSFIETNVSIENSDVNPSVMRSFIEKKGFGYKPLHYWFSTTNHCCKRSIISDFVDWYYPDCLSIKESHPEKLAFYHERVFYLYIEAKGYTVKKVEGLDHIMNNSHGYGGVGIQPDFMAAYLKFFNQQNF